MPDISLGGAVAARPLPFAPPCGQQESFAGKQVTVVSEALPLFSEQLRRCGSYLLRATQNTLSWTKVAAVNATHSVKQVASSIYAKAGHAGEHVAPRVRQVVSVGISAGASVSAGISAHIESAQQYASQYIAQAVGKSAQLTALVSTPIEALGITVGELAKTAGFYGALASPLVFPVAESCVGGIYRLLSSYRVSRADARAEQNIAKAATVQQKISIASERATQLREKSAYYKKLSERSVCSWSAVVKTALSCLPVALVVPQIGVPAAAVLAAGGVALRFAAHVWSSSRYSKLAGQLSHKAAGFEQRASALQVPPSPPSPPPCPQPNQTKQPAAKADRQGRQEVGAHAIFQELSERLAVRRAQLDGEGQAFETPQWGGLLKPLQRDIK